ncbi:thiolase domain-containing protein, partial [Candidatus Parvarchaeota archaeon]|nr:thiolase domain-containing protein [Candidatus Parvarchaeota archaeon]
MRKVAVVGVGMSKFGEDWSRGFRDMIIDAGASALNDAKIHGDKIDGMFIGT